MFQVKNKIILLLLLLPATAFPSRSDRQQTAYLKADHATYNRQTHVSTYIGHIRFSQGTTNLDADKLVIYDSKNNKIYKIVAFGKRAHYSDLPTGKRNILNAKANTIKYYPQKHIEILIGHAEVMQKGNKMRGPYITYNTKKQTVLLNSSHKDKTKITFQP